MEYSRIEDGLIALGYTPDRNNTAQTGDRQELAKFYDDFFGTSEGRPSREDVINGRVLWPDLEEALEAAIVARTRFAIAQNAPSNEFEIRRHQMRLQWLGLYDGAIDGEMGPRTREAERLFRAEYTNIPTPPTVHETPTVSSTPPPRSAENFTVYLDPGHGFWQRRGWYDSGTEARVNGRTVYEADIVLQHARAIAAELRERGIRVVMIRNDEDNIGRPVSEREDIAGDGVDQTHASQRAGLLYRTERALADFGQVGGRGLFISLHADAADNEEASRISIRYPRGADRGARFAEILAEEFNTDGITQAANGGDDAITRSNRFQVLRETRENGLPAVLVELGFMSNRADLGRLTSPTHRENTAEQFADAIERYRDR